MAIQKKIKDNKGVEAEYHKIHLISVLEDDLLVLVRSYIDPKIRDAERKNKDDHKKLGSYIDDTSELYSQLKDLMDNPSPDKKAIAKLTEEINQRQAKAEKPEAVDINDVETHYDETEIHLKYFEPLTKEAIYDKLCELPQYQGGKKI